jgi:NAD(P)-dependent dehydrogenase (short-subunit alcohol dehydrogenase family)
MSYIEQLFSLNGKVAVVTGGTGVLGSRMSRALAAAGAKVAILGRRKAVAAELAESIQADGGEALAVQADVLDSDQLRAAADTVAGAWGNLDILVNAAGGNVKGSIVNPDQRVFDMKVEDLRQALDLNLMGTILPTQIFGAVMADNKAGSIINISSMAADRAITRVMGYAVAKTAIDGYTRWMAVETARKYGDKVRVNAIAPGFFITEQNRALLTNEDGSYTERGGLVIQNTPMDRFGAPEELNGALLWLAGDASSFVTGTVVAVDGGFSCFSGV